MLHDLWNQRREDTDLVFTTTGRTAISGFSKAKGRLDDISKVVNWRLHDLRRTFASHCVDMGIDPVVADRVLNHAAAGTMSTVQRIYQRSEMLEPRRHALDAWSAWVFDAADGGIADGKVVLLHGI